jgi:hypothetical protein
MVMTSRTRTNILRLILIPSVITLAVTLLRLAGELWNWSTVWFNREPGGPGSVIGIVWLALIFGIYFALKLSKAGDGPASATRAIIFALAGVGIIIAGGMLTVALGLDFNAQFIISCVLFIVAAVLQYKAWPALFKTLLAYGLAARIPVVIVMFLAMQGNWQTHYDAINPEGPQGLNLFMKWFLYGVVPQLILWIPFTIIAGSLLGSIAVAVLHRGKTTAQAVAR